MPNITVLDIEQSLRYSELMALDPEKVDAAFHDALPQHYTEAQIMELGAFIAFHYGMQAWARTLDLGRGNSTQRVCCVSIKASK